MDITGTIKQISDVQTVSEKFKKRDFVLTDNSTQYPQHITFQLTQDKCYLMDAYSVGDEVKVHFNLRGNQWDNPKGETKYFNTLQAWRIEGINVANKGANTSTTNNASIYGEPLGVAQDDTDLPF